MAEALGVASSVIAIVDMSFKIIHLVGRYMSGVRGAKDDMRNLVAEITECHTAADEMDKLLKDPKAQGLRSSKELASTLDPARVTLKELLARLEKSSDSSLGRLKWPQMKDSIEDTVKRLARARERMLFMMNVDQTRQGQNIEHRIVIDNLPTAEGAAFDSHAHEHSTACMPDTRVELLEEISRWIDGTDSRVIFWLNGMAGTGKSTISQTVARSQSRAGRLGASFFFKKGEAGRGSIARFMSTLARQLADSVPGVGPLIKAVVDKDPDIGKKLVQQQFDKLIREPLATVLQSAATKARIVFVIDALDECEKDADIRLLVQVLASATSLRSHLRFFLTSRPDLSVRLGFRKAKDTYQDLVLHDIPESIVEHDLAVFFRNSFDLIRSDFNTIADTEDDKLPTEWPGDETVHELVSRSKPLFIFAATLCRFVSDPLCGNPKSLLGQILSSAATGSPLSQTYRPVLDAQLMNVPKSLRTGIIKDFILVVGSIVILAEPLGISSLASLLGESRDTICDRLRLLHAVLRVPQDDSPVRLLHLSFRDYLLDSSLQELGANQFHVDEDHAHQTVAESCIRLMRVYPLRQNIAGLSFPGMPTSDVDPTMLADAIPPALHYACRYWIHHWTSSKFQEHGGATVHDFLKEDLLYWFEAMSLLGHLGEALNALRSLLSWMQEHHTLSELLGFLNDAIRFLRSNFYIIERAPLQIYSSALALAPTQSIVKKTFISHIPSWLTLQPTVRDTWDACLAHFECPEFAKSVTFSHDSKRLAAGTWRGIVYVWNVETGEREAILSLEQPEVAKSRTCAIAFSSSSQLLALAHGPAIYLWTVQTGNRFRKLNGFHEEERHEGGISVTSVSFSADSKTLFTNINKGEIRAWDLESGACTILFDPRHGIFYRLVSSYDYTPLLLAYDGNIARICDINSQDHQVVLEGHGGSRDFEAMAFSHNHERIAITTSEITVSCWSAKSGKFLNEISLQKRPGRLVAVAFCGQSQSLIAAATARSTIYVWNVDTGEISEMQPNHEGRESQFVFSPNKSLLASYDGDVLIWDVHTLRHQESPIRADELNDITSLVFSDDARVLVSSHHNKSLRVWDVDGGGSEKFSVFSEPHSLVRVLHDFPPGSKTFGAFWELVGKVQGRVCVPEEREILKVKFSKSCDTLAVASRAGESWHIQLWNVMTQQKIQSLEPFPGKWNDFDEIDFLFFSEDLTMLAASITHLRSILHYKPNASTLVFWDTTSGACLDMKELPNRNAYKSAAIFLSNGKKLAWSPGSSLCLWDLESGNIQWIPECHQYARFDSLASSHDSKRLVSLSGGTKLWIWNLETVQCIAILATPCFTSEISVLPGGGLTTLGGIIPIDINAVGPFLPKTYFEGLGYRDDNWITWDGKPWFWLPQQHRKRVWQGCVRVQRNRIAIGCWTGEVAFFGINGATV